MKYALEEFRIGRWERLPGAPFDEEAEADKCMIMFHQAYPMRLYRIVDLAEETQSAGGPNERP